MDFSSGFSSSLQVIAALVIFVAGYLALILGAIMLVVFAELISDRAGVSQAYAVKSALTESCTLSASGAGSEARRSPRLQQPIFRH